jgi:hypothetical protein
VLLLALVVLREQLERQVHLELLQQLAPLVLLALRVLRVALD